MIEISANVRGVAKPSLVMAVQLPPPIHGAAAMNASAVAAVREADYFDCHVYNTTTRASYASLGVVNPAKLIDTAMVMARIAMRLLFRRPDLFYVALVPNGAAFYRDAALTGLSRLIGVKRVIHLHGKGLDLSYRGSNALKRFLYRVAFDQAHVIVLSDRFRDEITTFANPVTIVVVPNGIEGLTPRLNIAVDYCPTILYLSNFVESKGPLYLMESLGVLARAGVAFHAVFAGMETPTVTSSSLREMAQGLGIAGRVAFPGPAYGGLKDELLLSCDIFAFPTFNDAQPIAVLEAMSAGLAIVSTREGAIPDMIDNGVDGILAERRDPESLAIHLDELLKAPDKRRLFGQRARTKFLDKFSLSKFRRNLSAFLRQIHEQ